MTTGYEPRWDLDLARGEVAEALVDALVRGGRFRVEVKRDDRARDTGNLYVEYQCRRRDGWHPSGIATTEADYYAFVLGARVLFIPTDELKALTREAWDEPRNRVEEKDGDHPTRGVVVRVCAATTSDAPPAVEVVPSLVDDGCCGVTDWCLLPRSERPSRCQQLGE